jgi:hypothetical protein
VKRLEDENRRLKHIVAEQTLDIQALKAVVAKKWEAQGEARRRGVVARCARREFPAGVPDGRAEYGDAPV